YKNAHDPNQQIADPPAQCRQLMQMLDAFTERARGQLAKISNKELAEKQSNMKVPLLGQAAYLPKKKKTLFSFKKKTKNKRSVDKIPTSLFNSLNATEISTTVKDTLKHEQKLFTIQHTDPAISTSATTTAGTVRITAAIMKIDPIYRIINKTMMELGNDDLKDELNNHQRLMQQLNITTDWIYPTFINSGERSLIISKRTEVQNVPGDIIVASIMSTSITVREDDVLETISRSIAKFCQQYDIIKRLRANERAFKKYALQFETRQGNRLRIKNSAHRKTFMDLEEAIYELEITYKQLRENYRFARNFLMNLGMLVQL
ncbi:unnamed protein product, partial [Didymodactylos carnosus]